MATARQVKTIALYFSQLPSITQLLHTASPFLSLCLSLSLSFLPSFLPSLLLPLLPFPASWLSFGSTGRMTDEWEETRYGDIKERKNGLLFGVAPRTSHSELWRFYSHARSQSTVNNSNDTALCAILKISPIVASFGKLIRIAANVPITSYVRERDGETGTDRDVKWTTVFPKGSLRNNGGRMMAWEKDIKVCVKIPSLAAVEAPLRAAINLNT